MTSSCFQKTKLKLKGKIFNDILEIQQNAQQVLKGIMKESFRHASNNDKTVGLGALILKGSTLKGTC